MHKTIASIVESHAHNHPHNPAIQGVEGAALTYEQLFLEINNSVDFLNNLGIGRNDPVAIVLPNGPTMAAAFLCIASGAASAPLNPAYTEAEFEFYLNDLHAKAVVVSKGSESPVVAVANRLKIPIISLNPIPGDAPEMFTLSCESQPVGTPQTGMAKRGDIALILHTSGTTSRPKMVPLTQTNLCVSAKNICDTLSLTAADCCLNIMPLFHIHGLMAAVLASMTAGGSVVCTPGFYVPQFLGWMQSFDPTWYTAVPTMHQSILNKAKENQPLKKSKLRLIRSSSASLAPNVMEEMEKVFGVPVIEAYGMTEASHQIASNPLPPDKRKPGSVGRAAGPEVSIMAEDRAEMQPARALGEIVLRGENITLGYMNNPEANEKGFTQGWFRTGDQGYKDGEGYIYITGRLKEIINRGGEKISPREVDEVILEYPGVLQAVTFGVPDDTLGEEIAAAVVLKNPGVKESELKEFIAKKLAAHKVPQQILFLDEIPKGATGKIQRIGMAKRLGLSDKTVAKTKIAAAYEPPQNETERKICEVWQNALGVPKVGIDDVFKDLGGDSMLATLIQVQLEAVFGISVSLVSLYKAVTVREQATMIDKILKMKTTKKS